MKHEERGTVVEGTRHLENGGHVDSLNLGVMLACAPGPSGHHNLFEWANATVLSTMSTRGELNRRNQRDERRPSRFQHRSNWNSRIRDLVDDDRRVYSLSSFSFVLFFLLFECCQAVFDPDFMLLFIPLYLYIQGEKKIWLAQIKCAPSIWWKYM